MAKRTTRVRRWCFTAFSEEDKQELLDRLVSKAQADYCIIGDETCPTTGRRHLQGYIEYVNAATLQQMRQRLNNGAHLEPARGSANANAEYCRKGGNFAEWGKARTEFGQQSTAHAVCELILDGKELLAILREYPELSDYVVRNWRNLVEISATNAAYAARTQSVERERVDE